MKRAAVILAGGAGTRLYPLSSEDNPKQFLRVFSGRSLLEMTWNRLSRIVPPEAIFVSTNERYRAKCLEHLPQMPPANVLTEPARRNTAPAIALCTATIARRYSDQTAVAFLPSDAFIGDEPEFSRILDKAYDFAESRDYLVTVAIHATSPHTGFGYVELGDAIVPGVIHLRRFTEKPSREVAEEFLRAGNYAWNSGIFVWRGEVFAQALRAASPELADVSMENYETMPSTSIDYALMEKAPNVATVPGEFGWSDVGSFQALRAAGAEIPDDLP
ncbi:MAG: mannose-1-phosphate guanylyltransferase [Acidobacteriota bacterium]